MNRPLIWNSLSDATKWLSSETNEEWTANRIIDFCINDLERKRRNYGGYPSARIKVALPASVKVGVYRRKDDVKELEGKFFPKVAGGNLIKYYESGSKHKFIASLYLHNLYELLFRHETEITAISRDEDSFPFTHFELFEPIANLSDEWIEDVVHICGGKLPNEIISALGCPLRVTLDMVGVNETELEGILGAYHEINEPVTKNEPEKKNTKVSQVQIDKVKFQAIAGALWKSNPNLTQAEIINSDQMEFYRLTYKGKNTLRDWIRDVDPRPKELRRGRPKKHPPT